MLLYRWVSPTHVRQTPIGPEWREGVFKNFPRPEERRMSVVVQDRLDELNRSPASILDGLVGYGLIGIRAGDVREEEQRIERTPRDDEPAHGDVWGDKPGARRRKLAAKAFWVVPPPDPA